jgi:hypothetical protein
VTLQQQSLDELREMGCQGSLSKQIRASVELDVLLRKKVKEGYEISLKAPDGKLYKLELPN